MHEEDDTEVRTILERVASYYGFVPRIYQELRHNPAALKTFSIKMSSWRLTRRYLDLLKSSSRSELRLLSDPNIVSARTLTEQSATAPSMIRSFSRYCSGRPLPKLRRCPNHFACGNANVGPAGHRHRLM
jgi:hypothetical protein